MNDRNRKRYYSISEVAAMLDVKPHILRYWESEFPNLNPRKNRAGNRAYTERDIKIAMTIRHLLYDEKFTIAGAKKHLREEKKLPDDMQLEIPFQKLKTKVEIEEIRKELLKLIEIVEKL